MSTTTARRRSSLARRADAGTVAAYLREESSRVATHARPGGRPVGSRTGAMPIHGQTRRRARPALPRDRFRRPSRPGITAGG